MNKKPTPTTLSFKKYPAKIEGNEKEGYTITFRDLPNVFSEGDTRKETYYNGQEVLYFLLEDMLKDGLPIPEPSDREKGECTVRVMFLHDDKGISVL
jgi:predicted RNase H-like HicB family nuclease